jgi:catechol 2,3-dioxygenase-like lactoylglutathione lyase family enzyme
MKPDMILLSVKQPARSVAFYSDILGREPVDNSPTFAMFQLNDATMLGLWIETGIEPKVFAKPGAAELGVHVADRAAVDETHVLWISKNVPIAQAPTKMDFGYTFVGLDPDGHRLRVFCPE